MLDMSFSFFFKSYFEKEASKMCNRLSGSMVTDARFKFVLLQGKMEKQKYDPEYLKCEFSFIEDN